MTSRQDKQVVRFLLVPDAGAARRLRRLIAERGACGGVLVGTWRELLDLASKAYLVDAIDDDWGQAFNEALTALDDAFWTESLKVAPSETAAAVEAAYLGLLSTVDHRGPLPLEHYDGVPTRAQRRYANLCSLTAHLQHNLPTDRETEQRIVSTDSSLSTHLIQVDRIPGYPLLSPRQVCLLEKLDADLSQQAPAGSDAGLSGLLEQIALGYPTASRATALGQVQRRLFLPGGNAIQADSSLQWIGCRDFLEEIEVAAGVVQTLLAEHPELSASDIGVLVPDEFEYALAVGEIFSLAGLQVSGLPVERWRRDLGREAVLLFLYCRQKPSPAMAIAACLTSPLMPWAREVGAALAQKIMDGNYRFWPPAQSDRSTQDMLGLIREGDDSPASLANALRAFSDLLRASADLEGHLRTARAAVNELIDHLDRHNSLDWRELRRRVTPRYLASDAVANFNLEGITVWRESQEPWRAVRHLLVLGFAGGHYPAPVGNSPVFSDDEIAALNGALGVALPTRADRLLARRLRFRRQLAAVSDAVTFCVPRRASLGTPLGPADSHVFIADVLGLSNDAEGLVCDLDDAVQRAKVRHLAEAPAALASLPRPMQLTDLDLGRDLLELRVDAAGQPKPESPSSLETLMVSPLAWLLRRLEAEPKSWAPEEAAPALLGQIAHGVFEGLFAPGSVLPSRAGLADRVAELLEVKIGELAPFLRAPQWQVDRHNLVGSLTRAVQAWAEVLGALDAQILAGEVWLAGRFHGIAIHGQADLILGVGDERLLVVDYKRSSSAGRRSRMQRRYDSQASLYRTMLQSGGPKNQENPVLAERLAKAHAISIVYYLLNDQVALSDATLSGTSSVARWEVAGPDVSSAAITLIGKGLDNVRSGRVVLNGTEDPAYFEKAAGFKSYAFDVSPLVRLFARNGHAEGLE